MSETTAPDGAHGPTDDTRAPENKRLPLGSLILGSLLCFVALALLVGGGWGLWKDRVDRDSDGFVPIGSTELQTDTYAIVGDLRGEGPDWLYGSTLLGDARVRASSQVGEPLFIGIARKDDVVSYLQGVGYAMVEGFEITAETTDAGGAPPEPPSGESIWAASTQGAGEQTLVWTPRSGDWSVVIMNGDASANVDIEGDAGLEAPVLPWLAGALLILGGVIAFIGVRILVRATQPRASA